MMDGTSVMVQPSISRIPIPLLFIILAVADTPPSRPLSFFPPPPLPSAPLPHRRDPKAGSDEAMLPGIRYTRDALSKLGLFRGRAS